jgi:hypothetical protein
MHGLATPNGRLTTRLAVSPSLALILVKLRHKAAPPLALVLAPLLAELLAHLHSTLRVVGEDEVDLLERQVGGLGIAEVDERHEGEVQAHEDQVAFPCKAIDDDGRDHDNEEVPGGGVSGLGAGARWRDVPEPVAGDADCGALGTGVQGQDFGDVAPERGC